ncbi:methyltransferase type 11 [[Phormidium ambiguum] IAM M-71]|uniref:Methyltransferase type 11 n=1 Tax=[Phormidium ambiguum] IAM M-71 TaxID=454136 RepID=A0A1U7IAN1_9CYAN|nr:methyltransferase domain-containing protein [Phormidium ambiguum]OKH33590.1 methyltransferase type 11 [Phormidium ambiguum IAM M-71]
MNYLNLGCGSRFHPDWTNVDFVSTSEGVIAHNLNEGIPFSDSSFDVIYHSHVLEHFSKQEAELFLRECYRVLRPQGFLRVVVPDLEQIVRIYLTALEKASDGSLEWDFNYEWIFLEMYDQTVRNQPGGEMANYLYRKDLPNQQFVLERLGREANNLIEAAKKESQGTNVVNKEDKIEKILKNIFRFLRYPKYRRELLLKGILGKEYNFLQLGRFRQSGEIHQWMYDRYSLAMLLKKCGMENIVQRTATESYIANWHTFNLDTEPDGTVYKPDSLFMEAIKPSGSTI